MQDTQDRLRFARKVETLHSLGPRPLYEFLSELAGGDTPLALDIEIQLDRYGKLDPGLVDQLGGRELHAPLAVAEGGRR